METPAEMLSATALVEKHPTDIERATDMIRELIQVIGQKVDPFSALTQLNPEQKAALDVFESLARGMAIRRTRPTTKPELKRSDDGWFVYVPVPNTVTMVRMYSTAGFRELPSPLPVENNPARLRVPNGLDKVHIARIEFLDRDGKLVDDFTTIADAPTRA